MRHETYRWTAEWRVAAERWISERVAELGLVVVDAIRQPHVRPWATALSVPTREGLLWFKASIPSLAYEVSLLELLGRRRPDLVPRVLAADAARGWMLVEDAGEQLATLHADRPPVAAWVSFLGDYGQLQIDVAPLADELVACGVPDRRRDLVSAFYAVVERQTLLEAREVARLRALEPRLRAAADTLAALDLPDTIHHDDLHAWNVCIRDGRHRFIDWGDSSVAQPLLSLAVPVLRLDDRSDAAIARLRDAYLEPWTSFRPRDELAAASQEAVLLGALSGVLKWDVLYSSLPHDERVGYEDVIEVRLRDLLQRTCG